MKFYSPIEKNLCLEPLESSDNNIYSLFSKCFYYSLLSTKNKVKLLNCLDEDTKSILLPILKINQLYCDDITECDYVVIPPNYTIHDSKNLIIEKNLSLIQKSVDTQKKFLIFYGSDNDNDFNINEEIGLIFRSSGYRSKCNRNVIPFPTLNVDRFNNQYVNKNLSISFCGYVDNSENYQLRKNILKKLINVNCFDYNLNNNWGNKLENKFYFENIEKNLYGLCVRGGGNFSFRLGEIFMMGRIPILIDSDCNLPFRECIPYEKNTIYITKENSDDFTNIIQIIEEYHESHTEEELIKIQMENRKIWEEYFTAKNLYKNICNSIAYNDK
jgi:hypothetical protein